MEKPGVNGQVCACPHIQVSFIWLSQLQGRGLRWHHSRLNTLTSPRFSGPRPHIWCLLCKYHLRGSSHWSTEQKDIIPAGSTALLPGRVRWPASVQYELIGWLGLIVVMRHYSHRVQFPLSQRVIIKITNNYDKVTRLNSSLRTENHCRTSLNIMKLNTKICMLFVWKISYLYISMFISKVTTNVRHFVIYVRKNSIKDLKKY